MGGQLEMGDLATVTAQSMSYWFYSNTTLAAVTGRAHVCGLASMKQTFNGCVGLASLDLSGLDPTAIVDYAFTFAGCSNLVTTTVDATWALAASATGMATFYGCSSIVGGNGTVYNSSAYGYTRMAIDQTGQVGYLTST